MIFLFKNKPINIHLLHIGFQETFNPDVKALFEKLAQTEFKDTVSREHKNLAKSAGMPEKGIQHLSDWYKRDSDLYDYYVVISRVTNL